jgi:MFS family permease
MYKDYNSPEGSKIGLFNAIYNIGGLSALPFSAYIADGLGRRKGVAIGIIFIIIGSKFSAGNRDSGMNTYSFNLRSNHSGRSE